MMGNSFKRSSADALLRGFAVLASTMRASTTCASMMLAFVIFVSVILPVHAFSVIYKGEKTSLDARVIEGAFKKHQSLNAWQHFNTERIKKDAAFQQQVFAQENAQKITVTAPDGHLFDALFVDRGSDKAIMLGQGFHARKEYLLPFLKLFEGYDLLFFDYKGHRELMWTYLHNRRNTLTTYFIEPQKEVRALGAFLRNRKKYTSVIGLGMCYSGLIFCGAQAASERDGKMLFDKLILDSTIHSMQEVAFQVFKDPLLCCNHKTGGAPKFVQWMLSTTPVRFLAGALGWIFLGQQFSGITITEYLKHIHVPILFICAGDDKFIASDVPMRMYEAAQKDSCCMISFPCQHTLNHIKHKELYAHLVREFIELDLLTAFVRDVTGKID